LDDGAGNYQSQSCARVVVVKYALKILSIFSTESHLGITNGDLQLTILGDLRPVHEICGALASPQYR
jgi:hypothetical protein